jgi:hypothetical protein
VRREAPPANRAMPTVFVIFVFFVFKILLYSKRDDVALSAIPRRLIP